MKIIDISIAIVKNSHEEFLIALRPDDSHQGGKWEFPGGKVKANEAPEQAMQRELFEEVGLTAIQYQLFEKVFFDYGDKQLNLYFYLVDRFTGMATSCEGQAIKWITKTQLSHYDFPEANLQVINKL